MAAGSSSKFVDPKTRKITRQANPKEPKVYNEHFAEYTEEKTPYIKGDIWMNDKGLTQKVNFLGQTPFFLWGTEINAMERCSSLRLRCFSYN
ncbi:hypothetical protein DI43_01610 [Geobacillus sp. CAMR12739]|nr:hypothetical protein DI43_01610 [Geobacillus sp. CAMR12739]